MARKMRGAALAALGASFALALAGCSGSNGGGNDTTADADNPVEMTLWTNATATRLLTNASGDRVEAFGERWCRDYVRIAA